MTKKGYRKPPARSKRAHAQIKPLRLYDPLAPRMLAMLQVIEDHGGEYQGKQGEFGALANVHEVSVGRMARWLELYGAIHVMRDPPKFAQGAKPHRYVQLMSVEDYKANALEIREVVRNRLRPKRPKREVNPFPKGVAVFDPDEMRLIREQAKAEVLASIAAHKPLPKLEADPLDYEKVEGWNVAFNAE